MEGWLQDVRFALRMLRTNLGFTFVAALTLALGIGANTAIFSLLDQILLRSLPVASPGELVSLRNPGPKRGSVWSDGSGDPTLPYPMYRLLRDNNQVFSGLLARHPVTVNIALKGDPQRSPGELVSGNYFDVLGVRPFLGRVLRPDDEGAAGANPVVVLSHGYWTAKLGADPAVLNQRVLINNQPMTVVGIAQPGFSGVQIGRPAEFFLPMSMKPVATPGWNGLDDHNDYWAHLIGRLKPGITIESAAAQLQPIYRQAMEEQEKHFRSPFRPGTREPFMAKKLVLLPAPAGRDNAQQDSREPLMILMALALLVLLIAAFNLANLLITRGMARARQYTIRAALGASGWRLARQALIESWLIFMIGAGLALVVAVWLTAALIAELENRGASGLSSALNWRLLGFNFGVAFLAGTFAGLAPALRRRKTDIATALKSQGISTSADASAVRLRRVLITAEVALTLLLLTTAGLFARTLHNLRNVDLGLNPAQVVTFNVQPALNGYSPERTAAFFKQTLEGLRSQPGVQNATVATLGAFEDSTATSNFSFEGYTEKGDSDTDLAMNWVGMNYFSTMGTALLRGREFNEADFDPKKRVAILTEEAARKFFLNQDPIGRKLGQGGGNNVQLDTEIVGVVQDSRHATVRGTPRPMVFFPYTRDERLGRGVFYVRSSLPMETVSGSIRDVIRRQDSTLPINDMNTLVGFIDESLYSERLIRNLSLAFGGVAALLAAVGLYGLLAYTVVLRTRDIGIRVALGASRRDILVSILRQGLLMIGIGIAAGLPVAILASRAVRSLIFAIQPMDAFSFLMAILLLTMVGVLASYIPARRATKVDPMVALRYE